MTMGNLLKGRSFIGYALVVGFVHGGSFAYVSGTPFVYQNIYGVSPQTFSVLFGINGLAIITGSFIIGRFGGIIRSEERRVGKECRCRGGKERCRDNGEGTIEE